MARNLLALLIVTLAGVGLVGTALAEFPEGLEAYKRGDYSKALKEWRPLAEQGDAGAQVWLGFLYFKGMGVRRNYGEAIKWYRKAADQDNADAQHELGFMYYHGLGVAQDYAEAVKWFGKSAKQGAAPAQHYLGLAYLDGTGVPQDPVRAYAYFIIAEAQGWDTSMREIMSDALPANHAARAERMAAECAEKRYVGCEF